jgi:biopolymer transport protein ExbD
MQRGVYSLRSIREVKMVGITANTTPASLAALTAILLAFAVAPFVLQQATRPARTSTVLLSQHHHEETTDCMGRAIFLRIGPKGTTLLGDPTYTDPLPAPANIISAQVAQIMATRQERVVYVAGDPLVSYGDVAVLIAAIQGSTSYLNVIFMSQADFSGLASGMCLGVPSDDFRSHPQ